MTNVDLAELYEKLGSFGQSIDNHRRTMEFFEKKLDDTGNKISEVASALCVAIKESSLKRENCGMLFKDHDGKLQELFERTVRDGKHIKALETGPEIEKIASKKSKAWIALITGIVLFTLAVADFLWRFFRGGVK